MFAARPQVWGFLPRTRSPGSRGSRGAHYLPADLRSSGPGRPLGPATLQPPDRRRGGTPEFLRPGSRRIRNAMQLRAVSLDVGGTLLYERPSRFAIYAEAARDRGLQVSDEDMRSRMGQAHRRLPRELNGAFRYSDPWFKAFIAEIYGGSGPGFGDTGTGTLGTGSVGSPGAQTGLGLPQGELAPLTEELFERFENPATFRLFPGVRELLDGLRRAGVRVGVTSNWSARLPQVLHALDLAGAFDFVVCSALDRTEKPEPRIFELALERAGCPASETIHVGDRVDLDGAARNVGLEVAIIDHYGKLLTEPPTGPDGAPLTIVRDLDDLRERLLERT